MGKIAVKFKQYLIIEETLLRESKFLTNNNDTKHMKEFLFTKLNVMTEIYTTLVKQREHFKKVIKKTFKQTPIKTI